MIIFYVLTDHSNCGERAAGLQFWVLRIVRSDMKNWSAGHFLILMGPSQDEHIIKTIMCRFMISNITLTGQK